MTKRSIAINQKNASNIQIKEKKKKSVVAYYGSITFTQETVTFKGKNIPPIPSQWPF